jgi:plastocyanin
VTPRKWGILVAAALLAALSVGCGNAEEFDPTPVQTWKITPAADGGTPRPTGTAATTATGTAPAGTGTATAAGTATTPGTATAPAGETATAPSGEATTLEIAAVNVLFDKTELTAPAGKIIIKLDNRDGGVVHNINVFDGEDATAESVGATELEAGPVEQTLELELEPGSYFFQCDAHPATMSGTLTVT